jgi:hypothetical protein
VATSNKRLERPVKVCSMARRARRIEFAHSARIIRLWTAAQPDR